MEDDKKELEPAPAEHAERVPDNRHERRKQRALDRKLAKHPEREDA